MITQRLQYNAPNCAPPSSMWFGTSPSGTLQVMRVAGCLKMNFVIPAERQRLFHPHPNAWHNYRCHTAELPDTLEGRNMLFRFQFAFLNGLCFEVDQFSNVNWTRLFIFPSMGLPSNHHMMQYSAVMDHFSIPNDPQMCYQWIMTSQLYFGASPILSFSTGALMSTNNAQSTYASSSVPSTVPLSQYYTSSSYASSYVTSTAPSVTASVAARSSPGTSTGYFTAQSWTYMPATTTFTANPSSYDTSIEHSTAPSWNYGTSTVYSTAASSSYVHATATSTADPSSYGTSTAHSTTAATVATEQKEVICFRASRARSSARKQHAMLLDPVLSCREGDTKQEECSICLENMVPTSHVTTTDVVCIKACRHRFHKHCMMQLFEQKHENCPYCRAPLGIETFGQGPSGRMVITVDLTKWCKGFEHNSDGTIVINYTIPAGIQHNGMEHPGQNYSGTQTTAYLPHNEPGRELLVRLKYAFTHGLTFRVGTSITTGELNRILWGSVPHKTSTSGDTVGFPDPLYFPICNQSLDELKVPKAKDCMYY